MTQLTRETQARRRAAGLSGRGALGAAAALIAVMFMGSTLLTPLYALYRSTYGLSIVGVTLLYAVYVVGNLAALLLLGRLSDQLGRRPVALAAMALAAASAGMFLAADSAAWLFAARIVSGLSVGLASGAGAAWTAELIGGRDRQQASTIATVANFLGIAAGPVVAGILAQYAPLPQRTPFVAYLACLLAVAVAVAISPETVERTRAQLSLEPRLGVPAACRARFAPPAVSIFGVMALVGFYAALIPTILREALHEANLAVAGAVSSGMFLVTALAIVATRNVAPRTAMLWGLGLQPPAVALLVWAQAAHAWPVLVAASALAGLAAAPGYRGSLQVTNEIAPADRRAEVVSTYFLVGFAGNALPVVGVGLLTAAAGALAASAGFAIVIAAFALAALAYELRRGTRR